MRTLILTLSLSFTLQAKLEVTLDQDKFKKMVHFFEQFGNISTETVVSTSFDTHNDKLKKKKIKLNMIQANGEYFLEFAEEGESLRCKLRTLIAQQVLLSQLSLNKVPKKHCISIKGFKNPIPEVKDILSPQELLIVKNTSEIKRKMVPLNVDGSKLMLGLNEVYNGKSVPGHHLEFITNDKHSSNLETIEEEVQKILRRFNINAKVEGVPSYSTLF